MIDPAVIFLKIIAIWSTARLTAAAVVHIITTTRIRTTIWLHHHRSGQLSGRIIVDFQHTTVNAMMAENTNLLVAAGTACQ